MIYDSSTPINKLIEQLEVSEGEPLYVADGTTFIGSVTDGDVRRGIINGISLSDPVSRICNKHAVSFNEKEEFHSLSKCLLRQETFSEFPWIDIEGRFRGLISREKLIGHLNQNTCCVIMAGGLGSRLGEITEKQPKPMVKVGDEPMLTHVLKRLKAAGLLQIKISVNYLKQQIIDYYGDGSNFGVEIEYIHEETRLGTAGSISLITQNYENYIVINSDILTDIDMLQFALSRFHAGADAAAAIITQSIQIPFGVVEVGDFSKISVIKEKPSQNYNILSGIYSINRSIKNLLKKGEFYDMPDLLELSIKKGFKIHAYANDFEWIDMGTPKNLKVADKLLNSRNIDNKKARSRS